MKFPQPDKWTALLLSLAVPGAGQLCRGSWSCLPWFLTAGLLGVFWHSVSGQIESGLRVVPQVVSLVLLGLASGIHAKRKLESVAVWPRTPDVRSRVICLAHSGRRVEVRIEVDVRLTVDQLWRRASDLPRFLTIDPFHQQIILMRPIPAAGVDLALAHNVFGRRHMRFGRILSWRPGYGYAFSDLARRNPLSRFPHVFFIRVDPLSVESAPPSRLTITTPPCIHGGLNVESAPRSRLTITVKGKWTSRWVPVWLGRAWLRWVGLEHARLLRKAM